MFRSMISSRKMTLCIFPSAGSSTTRLSTLGTCTVANSSSSPISFLRTSAAMFRVLFRISGKGLEESTAMGVSTGYTFSSKYLSTKTVSFFVRSSCLTTICRPFCFSFGTRERL